MAHSLRKSVFAALAGALALSFAAPAQARHNDDGDDAAIAIGAGVVGLALGAALASNRDDRHDYDDGYYTDGGYYDRGYYRGYPRAHVYRYDRYPRHDRHWRGRNWNDGSRWRHRNRHRGGWNGHWRDRGHYGRHGW